MPEVENFLAKIKETIKRSSTTQNYELIELGLRAAITSDARQIIENLYNDRELYPDDEPAKPLETRYKSRSIQVNTIFGTIQLKRNYYHHYPSNTGRAPLDEKLQLEGKYTPALARIICRAASMSPSFEQGSTDLNCFAGIEVNPRQFGRLAQAVAPDLNKALETITIPETAQEEEIPVLYIECDGTGTPMRKDELIGRKGKQKDGSSKTREAKLGCVFTQTLTDMEGKPIRDPNSTSYVGTYENCRSLAVILHQEAQRRGLSHAQKIVCLGDGAAWIWNNFELTFPTAIQILDFYHASEYVMKMAGQIHPEDKEKAKALYQKWKASMKKTSPKKLISESRLLLSQHPEWSELRREKIESKIGYLESHSCRTNYGEYRAQGYFIGSGVIEAGCKTVVGGRLKQSGMFWSKPGAENILGMRCLYLGQDLDRVWKKAQELKAIIKQKARRWLPGKKIA